MSGFLALCNTPSCGTIFVVNNLIQGAGRVTLNIGSVGPCPVCGGQGKLPDGEYELNDTIATFIKGPDESVEILNKIKAVLERFKNQTAQPTREEIVEEVEKISPTIADFFRNASASNILFWISFLMTIIEFSLSMHQTFFIKDDKGKDKIIEMYIDHLNRDNKKLLLENEALKSKAPQIIYQKIGRNDPCHCKSGLKYKKCHGK